MPTPEPGQLWYVYLASTEYTLSPLEYRALTAANVVIYDGALAPTVARSLPLGGYAELAVPRDRAAERCLRFARDGWSVARLIDLQNDWVDDLRRLSERLLEVRATSVLSISVILNAEGSYKKLEVNLAELGDLTEALGSNHLGTMTAIIDGIKAGTAPRFAVASANGLAG